MTFTLTGFRTVVRQDIQIQGAFAAQVNADLQIGALEETLTVTGASPTVDVINNQTQVVLDRDVLDAIPTTARNLPMRAALIPGSSVTFITLGQYAMTIHGSSFQDTQLAVDGMRINTLCGQGQYSGFYLNDAAAQEITYTTGAESAEIGERRHAHQRHAEGRREPLRGQLLRPGRLRAAAGRQPIRRGQAIHHPVRPGINYEYQINPSFGGPIDARPPLVLPLGHGTTATSGSRQAQCSPTARRCGTHPMQGNYSFITRVTWQATQANKFRLYLDRQYNGEDYNNVSTTISPEAAQQAFGGGWTPQVKWTSTPTSGCCSTRGLLSTRCRTEWPIRTAVGPHRPAEFRIDDQQTHRGDDESLHQLDRQLRDGRVGVAT